MTVQSSPPILAITALCLVASATAQPTANAVAAPDIKALISQMTLAEKIAQLNSVMPETKKVRAILSAKGEAQEGMLRDFAPDGLGMCGFEPQISLEEGVAFSNLLQGHARDHARLHIPILWYGEGLHGFAAQAATVFPQNPGLGSTWDRDLIRDVYTAVAQEMRSRGVGIVLSPVIDLAREPRWGRSEECYGEDPYHVGEMGLNAVRGFQGDKAEPGTQHVFATLKHFVGHGEPFGGRNVAPINLGERTLRSTHLIPFERCVREGRASAVMVSYNAWDGIPNHANPYLLQKLLRGDLGFTGLIMSDGGGIDMLRVHRTADDPAALLGAAFSAGIEFALTDDTFGKLKNPEINLPLSRETLDACVEKILRFKERLGLFQFPETSLQRARETCQSAPHRALALRAAHEAMVLLKNDANLLPLAPKPGSTLAVIGPNASEVHFGGYAPEPRFGVTPLDGVRAAVGDKVKVTHAEGCRLIKGTATWWFGLTPELADPVENKRLIAEAVEVAKNADVVVLALGENESLCREAFWDGHRGDVNTLELFGQQNELVEAIAATGKPIVALLFNGRPLALTRMNPHAQAIVECWYLGQETGTAVADLLFGKVNPSGKLAVSFPRSVGDLPAYYNRLPSVARGYVGADNSPLYAFGHGLSYTKFTYGAPRLDRDAMTAKDETTVHVTVTNSGPVEGDEIVQLYIKDEWSTVERPVLELKDFARISLKPGESREVSFPIRAATLDVVDATLHRSVEPGTFLIKVGPSSVSLQEVKLEIVRD